MSHSIAPSSISGHAKTSCPCCDVEITVTNLFNHIAGSHKDKLLDVGDSQWFSKAEPDAPFKMTYLVKNDFNGNRDLSVSYFACLASKKTFTTIQRALAHFAKNQADFTEHKKQARMLFTRYTARANKMAESDAFAASEYKARFAEHKKTSHPLLVRPMYSLTLYQRDKILEYKERLEAMHPFTDWVCDSTICSTYRGTVFKKNDVIRLFEKASQDLDEAIEAEIMDYDLIANIQRRMQVAMEATLHLVDNRCTYKDKYPGNDSSLKNYSNIACPPMPPCPF